MTKYLSIQFQASLHVERLEIVNRCAGTVKNKYGYKGSVSVLNAAGVLYIAAVLASLQYTMMMSSNGNRIPLTKASDPEI